MRFRAVDPLVNLLPDGGVEAAIALGKAADPQITVAAGYSRRRNTRQVQLRGRAPADAAGDRRVVGAAENAARSPARQRPGRCPVTRSRCRPKLRTCGRKPGIGRSCARVAAAQAPVASSRLNTRAAPLRSQLAAISIDTGAGSRAPVPSVAKLTSSSAETARSRRRPSGSRSSKPWSTRQRAPGPSSTRISAPCKPFRPRPVLPIAVAGVELSGMRGEHAHFRAAHEPARIVPRPRRERDRESFLRRRSDNCGLP